MSKFGLRAFVAIIPLVCAVSAATAEADTTPSKQLSAGRSVSHFPTDVSAYKPLGPELKNIRRVDTPSIEGSMSTITTSPSVMTGFEGPAPVSVNPAIPPNTSIGARNYGLNRLGTLNHYSDKLVPNSGAYPFRTTGWFIFTQYDGSTARCSAALIAKSILLTAGHCVHKGGGGSPYWITNGQFAPAYSNGTLPYGYANAASVYSTSGWINTGALDQGYDVALVVLGKRSGTTSEIGNYTGTLSFCYLNCLQTYWMNTQLGFPANYSGGNVLTESQHLEYSDTKDFRAGTGMQGGSSGGPHITNIGSLIDTSTYAGSYPYRNVAFAVTSWGFNDQTVKIGGFSTTSGPGNTNNFKVMYNNACNYSRQLHGVGSCVLIP